jgi:hypothetical protein
MLGMKTWRQHFQSESGLFWFGEVAQDKTEPLLSHNLALTHIQF